MDVKVFDQLTRNMKMTYKNPKTMKTLSNYLGTISFVIFYLSDGFKYIIGKESFDKYKEAMNVKLYQDMTTFVIPTGTHNILVIDLKSEYNRRDFDEMIRGKR